MDECDRPSTQRFSAFGTAHQRVQSTCNPVNHVCSSAGPSTGNVIVNTINEHCRLEGGRDADAIGGSVIGFVMAAPAAAEEMSLEQARRFVVGKLFEVRCFEGTRAIGRIYGDGSVIGTIQFRGTGPSAWLPAGTLQVKDHAVCASLKGMPFEPCFKLNRTSDESFRGSVLGFEIAYCDFTRRFGWRNRLARADDRGADGPLRLHPCTGVQEQC
jgi:hypothetical protein